MPLAINQKPDTQEILLAESLKKIGCWIGTTLFGKIESE
jgi:hypothetical protein